MHFKKDPHSYAEKVPFLRRAVIFQASPNTIFQFFVKKLAFLMNLCYNK